MFVAGTRLTETEVGALSGKLRDADMSDYADRLENAYLDGERVFSLSAEERAVVYDALDECPQELLRLWANLQEQLVF